MGRRRVRRRIIVGVVAMAVIIPFFLPSQMLDDFDGGWQSPAGEIVDNIIYRDNPRHFISHYDDLFLEISTRHGNHWCLMSAIAYVESRFKPHAVSRSGAVGLMQVMPRIGIIYGVARHELLEPRRNIETGNIHYNAIERMLDIPQGTMERDRISLVLASYNGGIGHVFDAQRLARVAGEDPHTWEAVARGLMRLRTAEGYSHPAVRFGSFRAAAYAVRYVDDVMAKYDEYMTSSANGAMYLHPYAMVYE